MNKLTTRQRDKLVESAQNAITITVQGHGDFPFDMLRYDHCWPATEADSRHIHDYHPTGGPRQVTLRGLTGPTPARWRSFGWTVTEEI